MHQDKTFWSGCIEIADFAPVTARDYGFEQKLEYRQLDRHHEVSFDFRWSVQKASGDLTTFSERMSLKWTRPYGFIVQPTSISAPFC